MNFKKSVELAEFYVLNETKETKEAKQKKEDKEHSDYLKTQLDKTNYTDSKGKPIKKEKIISEILKKKEEIKNKNKNESIKENIGIITHDRQFFEMSELDDNGNYHVNQIITYNKEAKNGVTEKSDIIVTSFDKKKLPNMMPTEKGKIEPKEMDINKIGKNYRTGKAIKNHQIDTKRFYQQKEKK